MFGSKQKRIEELERQLTQALALAEGCQKHPSYRGVRKPTADCPQCREVYRQRVLLNSAGLAVRKGTRGPNRPKNQE